MYTMSVVEDRSKAWNRDSGTIVSSFRSSPSKPYTFKLQPKPSSGFPREGTGLPRRALLQMAPYRFVIKENTKP
jgi:hypothetical protein